MVCAGHIPLRVVVGCWHVSTAHGKDLADAASRHLPEVPWPPELQKHSGCQLNVTAAATHAVTLVATAPALLRNLPCDCCHQRCGVSFPAAPEVYKAWTVSVLAVAVCPCISLQACQ